ncbi:MAG: putative transposase [Pseudohongiellaceae bacterium]|jgi:putative transposase
MARPLRIEYPDAMYHVSNYGLDGQRVFPAAKYFEAFVEGLAETCSRLNVEVHAFCLLRDQYHLVIKTPEANLSRFMRQVDGLYTQQYQKLKKSEGSLFKGRYKAVLVQADKYLLPLSRYIHTRVKPSEMASYPWSSFGLVTGKAKPPVWFNRDETLNQIKAAPAKRSAAYTAFVAEGVDTEIAHFYGKKNLSSVMGDEKFKASAAKKKSSTTVRGVSRGANAKWRPSCKQIITAVAKQFKVDEVSIYKAARGPGSKNVPRWVAMYLCQELSAVTLQTIAKLFKLKRYGTVSTTVGKLKKEFAADPKLLATTEKLIKQLSKSK